MPLILLSGYPSSGKTYRSEQLLAHFRQRIATSSDPRIAALTLLHISDDTLSLSRNVYATARAEKDARAAFASAIKRHLSPTTILLADGMNYIKGFRYQLYCEAKAVRTPSCVLHVGTQPEQCRAINAAALAQASPTAYDSDVFENLIFRFEEPNPMARWDAPLFALPYDDPEPPFDLIWDALIGSDGKAKVVRPNAATVLKPAASGNFLYELDRATTEIVAAVVEWQRDHVGEGGGEVSVPGTEERVVLPAGQAVGLPKLQRLRRGFMALQRAHGGEVGRMREGFVGYLNDALGGE